MTALRSSRSRSITFAWTSSNCCLSACPLKNGSNAYATSSARPRRLLPDKYQKLDRLKILRLGLANALQYGVVRRVVGNEHRNVTPRAGKRRQRLETPSGRAAFAVLVGVKTPQRKPDASGLPTGERRRELTKGTARLVAQLNAAQLDEKIRPACRTLVADTAHAELVGKTPR
ncbi:MAG: hypothetical protein Ct9H300mP32_4660 [Verrucomicrobiota bacterium]|nr:MAG: hypothetical protein Ct9H300mP32_4660 [Verrucomicrobiota bacterium]